MNKYKIMTALVIIAALVKAGCDLNKLLDEKSSESEYDRIVKCVDGKEFTNRYELDTFLIDTMGFTQLPSRYVYVNPLGVIITVDHWGSKYVLRVE